MQPFTATVSFWCGCIPARCALAYAMSARREIAAVAAVTYAMTGASLLLLHATRSRLRAAEAAGGTTWWDGARPLFGLTHLAVAAMYATGRRAVAARLAWCDPALGAMVWLRHRA